MATCVTGQERMLFEHFDLALMGYDAKFTAIGFNQFIENNKDSVSRIDRGELKAIFKDGTRIKALPIIDEHNLRGRRFDQLILVDDERWMIDFTRDEDIRIIKALTMKYSNVPEEFQILKYEN